jgi:hypothetical protein
MKRILKWIGVVVLSMVLLVLMTAVLLNTPKGKKIIVAGINTYLNKKLGNAVQIGSLDFSIPKWVELKNVYIKDQANDTLVFAHYLRVDMNMRSFFGSKWVLNDIQMEKAVININQIKNSQSYNFQFIIDAFISKSKAVNDKEIFPSINLTKLQLRNIQLRFNDSSQAIYSKIEALNLQGVKYDEKKFYAHSLVLNHQFSYNKINQPFLKKGFDFNHIHIQQNLLLANQLKYDDGASSANIKKLTFIDQTGFKIIQSSFLYQQKDSSIHFNNIQLKSTFSAIEGAVSIQPQLYKLVLRNTSISRKDIQLLWPTELAKLQPALSEINSLTLNLEANGNEKLLNIQQLEAASNNQLFYINTKGTIANFTNPNQIQYQLSITRLTTLRQVVYAFLPNAQQAYIQLPSVLSATGFLSGTLTTLSPNLLITSAYGQLGVKGMINNFANPQLINYDLVLNAQKLETGKWVQQDSLFGKFDGVVIVKGRGTNYKTLQLNSNTRIHQLMYNKVLYTNATISLNANNGLYKYQSNIKNELLNASLQGTASLNKAYPTINAKFAIHQANIMAMGFVKDSLKLRTRGVLDLNNLDPNLLDISIILDSVEFLEGLKKLAVDSISLTGEIDTAKQTNLKLRSAFLDANLQGKFKYTDLRNIFLELSKRYSTAVFSGSLTPLSYSLTSAITAKPHMVYAALLPGLLFSKNILLNAGLNSIQTDSSVWGKLVVPELTYEGNHISMLNASVNGFKDSLKLLAIADTLKASSILLHNTKLMGGYTKNGFTATVNTIGQQAVDVFSFGIHGNTSPEDTRIRFMEKLLLKNKLWTVSPQNDLVINNKGFYLQHMLIENDNQSILLNSQEAVAASPLQVKITDFALSNITNLMNKDSLLVEGVLNVDLVANHFTNPLPSFDGMASIDSLVFQQVAIGNLVLKATSSEQTGVDFNGSLNGNGNQLLVAGKYNQQQVNAKVQLSPLQMSAIEPFTMQYLTKSQGSIYGDITISGNVASLVWNGNIRFDSIYTVSKDYGTVIRLTNQKIELAYPSVLFKQFTIADSLNNELVVNGSLTHTSGVDFKNNLTVRGKNFIAVDNAALLNSNVYGRGIISVDADVKGTISAPDIAGNIALQKGSKITFVRQQIAASAKDQIGVIQFVDMDTVKPWTLPIGNIDPPKKSFYASALHYNLNIDVDKEAEFILVIDPITRDELSITGSAQLNAMLNPNGSISLIGAYNLSKGSYQLNYSFLKRKFALQEGSTILFSGDPEMAEANITAVYEIEASPFDLIGTEISGNSSNDLFRQKMPFEVVLKVKGQVLEPQLSFDIKLKDKVAGINSQMLTTIDNKLTQLRSDASGMNKEVFALLVMGRFIGEQSSDFFAGSNSGVKADQVVKESVSRFLSDAVSQIASDLIKGVDIDVNLRTIDEYSSSTQRTDLGLALSKRFLDDRLTISVGKNFTVEGNDPIAKGQNNANISFLPDVSTAYKLSKDGRYILKAYRRNQYEAILDGYFIETGLAFSLSMEYNKFNELLKKSK